MSQLTDTLHDLIEICRDGHAFYDDCAGRVDDPEIRETLRQMSSLRSTLVDDFSALLASRGEAPPEGGTLVGSMHQLYTRMKAGFSNNRDGVYVSELEEAEDRLLHSFEEAMLSIESPEALRILKRYVPLARAAHERMRQLKVRKGE